MVVFMEKNLKHLDSVEDLVIIREELRLHQVGFFSITNNREQEEKKFLDLEKNAYLQKKLFEESCEFCLHEIESNSYNQFFIPPNRDAQEIPLQSFKINENAKAILRTKEFWQKNLENLTIIKSIINYEDDVLISLYSLATYFFKEKRYQESIKVYTFLCFLNPSISSFWNGIGLAFEANDQLFEAMEAFEKAVPLEPSKFTPYISLIRCSEKVNEFSKVKTMLIKALEVPELEKMAEAALEYLLSIKH
jgi:tetratricopeptide (TPR) repeat protein